MQRIIHNGERRKVYMASSKTTRIFADILGDLMFQSKKSIKELADKIDISTGALSKYQNDNAEIGVNALKKIADYFAVSTDYLLGGAECKDPTNEKLRKLLGLSEKAIENKKKHVAMLELPGDSLDRYQNEAVNILLEDGGSESGNGIISALAQYLFSDPHGRLLYISSTDGMQIDIPYEEYFESYSEGEIIKELRRLKSDWRKNRAEYDRKLADMEKKDYGEHQED